VSGLAHADTMISYILIVKAATCRRFEGMHYCLTLAAVLSWQASTSQGVQVMPQSVEAA
jgi:hypothetical protein